MLRDYGIPYYLKIDIEAADMLCVRELHNTVARPRFLSIEISFVDFADAREEFSELSSLGYTRFKIVNQYLHSTVTCPRPAREGSFVNYQFTEHGSGPFGEETPGPWVSIDEALLRAEVIVAEQAIHGAHGILYQNQIGRHYRDLRHRAGDPIGWYDIHAGL